MWRFNIVTLLVILINFTVAQDRIIFPHQFHIEDMELSCEDCHGIVADATDLAIRLLPEKDSCLECHDGDTATEDCEACHADTEDPLPFSESQPLSGMTFSHQYHLAGDLVCSSCHPGVAEDDGSELPAIWQEHDCRSCHEQSLPTSHTIEWAWLHAAEVTHQTQSNCNLCHQQAACDACHQVQEVEPKVHPAGFLLMHGLEAYAGLADCAVCHNNVSDCRSCHKQNLVMPMDHNLPNWTQPGSGTGGLHADNAMNDPEICLACHQPATDRTCSRCHGSL
ncbi:MAG: cytochrome c3 family protein [Candidatus Marinimicrobia bacterium]|nr:cytochrome c3 family protein [Candidatus Neomarinimicrobiota bacterium]